jgi:hypothetical protein
MTQVLMSYRGGSKQNIFIHITLQASRGDDDVTCQNAEKEQYLFIRSKIILH